MKTDVTWFRKSSVLYPGTGYHSFGIQFPRGDGRRVMSRSELVQFGKSPHRWLLGYKEGDTACTEWGNLIDTVVLTPERVDSVYAIAPETYPAKGKKKDDPIEYKEWNWNATYCKEWRAHHEKAGKIVIKSRDLLDAWQAQKVIMSTGDVPLILAASEKQVVIVVDYVDEQTGLVIPVKCALDIVPDPKSDWGTTLLDLKTTENSSPSSWRKHVFSFGYHIQAAMYMDAYNTATGLSYDQFGHIVQESFAPYETAKRLLSEEFLRLGRAEYRRLLADYCYCLKNNWWPGEDEYKASNGKVKQIDGWTIIEHEPWMELV